MVTDIFMRACVNSRTAKVTALVTGHPDTKVAKYAGMYGIPKTSIYTYETFDRILENKDVDAVYIGLLKLATGSLLAAALYTFPERNRIARVTANSAKKLGPVQIGLFSDGQ